MGLLDRFRRKKEDEPARVARLLQTGRIVEGTILDIATDSKGKVTQVFYCYQVSRVEYESSQEIAITAQLDEKKYIPGAPALVRYDPRQPANSIVV